MDGRSRRRGVVSVVVVNYRCADDTIACLRALRTMRWPTERLEVVCVDNASGDGGDEEIRRADVPGVTVHSSPVNTGFAGGCNLGARLATGEYVAFINPDARPEADWLSAAVDVLEYDGGVACVASRVLDEKGSRIDYVGGGLTFYGMGYKREAGREAEGVGLEARDVLFPTGSAMVVRADVFERHGGFDERFFMFFEDVDLGLRLNLAGHRVRYVPSSVVLHKHHVSISKFGTFRERYLLERNALLTIFKNFEQSTLDAVLAPSLMLAVVRSVALGQGDAEALDLQRRAGDESPRMEVDKHELTGPYAIAYLAENFEELSAQRAAVQATRLHTDAALARLFEDPMEPIIPDPAYLKAFAALTRAFDVAASFGSRRRILVVTADTLADRMAGPAIRAYHIARVLATDHEVKLVSTTHCSLPERREGRPFDCLHRPYSKMYPLVEWAEIVIFQGFVMHFLPWLSATDKIIVADVYDPMHLEQLEQLEDSDPAERWNVIRATTTVLNDQLARGDFFMCASETQRKFWLGQLAALGRVNPLTYDRDSSLSSLIAVCPFGLSAEPPTRQRAAIKGVVPGIDEGDKVVIWAGGVYNWLDPSSVILAIDIVRREHPEVKLFFLGMQHPNPDVPRMRAAYDARVLADELGLTDKHVFFNEGWVDYDDRQNYLLDADLGISTHFQHVETTFSFRTRILDYLWANLPVVVTGGDTFGDLVSAEGLGVAVRERDEVGLAEAITRVLFDDDFNADCRANVARVRQEFVWERALAPLVAYCRRAEPAPDRAALRGAPVGAMRAPEAAVTISGSVLRRNLHYARVRLREGGVPMVARRGAAKARRLARERLSR